MPEPWTLHPTLAADCHVLGRLDSAHLLLQRNAALHWFILVPETRALDLLDLEPAQRRALMDDAARVAGFLKGPLAYERVNVGALGLLVPQLHLHVVGRREGDGCWPRPVWGQLPDGGSWDADTLAALRASLASPGSDAVSPS
jgi:diadenosine tetraphosphate (Ap4A) HIT family hydrolase